MNAAVNGSHYGALPEEWIHLDLLLGLTEDLLPVASDITRSIAPTSKLRQIGKVPSRYTPTREVVGIADWTSKRSTDANIEAWSRDPDLGACIQTRRVRAIDIDIEDAAAAQAVRGFVLERLGIGLPTRARANSGKLLLAFRLAGDIAKRSFKCEHGLVEFLATGQQFVACGTHPSGVRYEWTNGLPASIPDLSTDQFEALWSALVERFAIEPEAQRRELVTRTEERSAPTIDDPVTQFLHAKGLALGVDRVRRVAVMCPWRSEHTGDSGESETTWLPAGTGGFDRGHFKCLHAHCAGRTDAEFKEAIGYTAAEHGRLAEDFDVVEAPPVGDASRHRFELIEFADFIARPPVGWLVDGLLPRTGLAAIYGASGSGKSFFAVDLVGAVARGVPWRGIDVEQGRVVYVAAEGADGMALRMRGYAQQLGVDPRAMPLAVVAGTVNLFSPSDDKELSRLIDRAGGAAAIVIDTLAQATPGADENAGKDMGLVVANCQRLQRATGALVLLIAHTGKDEGREERGWSGLRAALDASIKIVRPTNGATREARLMKSKDGADGLRLPFRLRPVMVCVDNKNRDVTTCVVEHLTAADAAPSAAAPKGGWPALVWKTFLELAPVDGKGVSVGALVSAAAARMAHDPERRDQRRYVARRAIDALVVQGFLEMNGDAVCLPGGDD